jgi:hypothetical protein
MGRAVQVRADVQRHGDLLAARLVKSQPLDPANGRPGVAGKRGRMQREILGQIDEFHAEEP